jgi:hypothetical protein
MPYGLAVADDGRLAVVGSEDRSDQGQDMNWVIRVYQTTLCGDVPDFVGDAMVFPNPVHGDTMHVALKLKGDASEVVVDVYNEAFQRVFTGTWKEVRIQEAVLEISGISAWAPGRYLVKARAKLAAGSAQAFPAVKMVVKR